MVHELCPAVGHDHMVGTCSQEGTGARTVLEMASGGPSDTDVGMAVAWDAAYRAEVLVSSDLAGMRTDQDHSLGLASCLLHEEVVECLMAGCCSLPCTHHCIRCKQPLAAGEAQAFFVPSVVRPCVVQRMNRSRLAMVSGILDASIWWGRRMVRDSLALEVLAQAACD